MNKCMLGPDLKRGFKDQPGQLRLSLGALVSSGMFMSDEETDSNLFWSMKRADGVLKPGLVFNPQGWS